MVPDSLVSWDVQMHLDFQNEVQMIHLTYNDV